MSRKLMGSLLIAGALLVGTVVPALANDHLADATASPGAAARGFANPVAANPSGNSGARAMPATVPGQGNPNFGQDLGTPSVDLSLVTVRSGGHGNPGGAQ